MLLSALTFAAMLQAAPLVDIPATTPVQLPPPPIAKETRGAKQLAAWQAKTLRLIQCNRFGVQHAQGATPGQAPPAKPLASSSGKAKRLGELPPAHAEWAVARTVDGCPVATPVTMLPGKLNR